MVLGNFHTLVHVDQAAKAIDAMDDSIGHNEPFDVIFLDHDLGLQQFVSETDRNTGSEVVRWLVANATETLRRSLIIVHSHNPPAAENMHANLKGAGFDNTHLISFAKLCGSYFKDPSFLA